MRPINRNTGTLLILGAAHSLNHSLFLVLPPLLEIVSGNLDASFQTMGLIVTFAYLIYGAGALLGGPLSDYMGPVKVARISIGLAGASAFIFIISRDVMTFSAGMFLMALWASFYHPTSNNLIMSVFTSNTAAAMGIHGAAGSVGQIFTPTVAYLIGAFIDWRLAFVFFGALSVATSLLMGRIPSSGAQSSTVSGEKLSPLAVFKAPSLWVLFAYNIFIGLFYRGVELFFPTFLSVGRGFSGELAAISNSLILFFGVIGQYLGGTFADRFGSARVVLIASAGMLASMLLLLLTPVSFVGVILFIVIFGASYFGHQPAMTALVGVKAPRNLAGTAFGVMFFFAFGLGSISAAIAGYLANNFSLDAAFWTLALFSLATFAVSLIIVKTSKK